MPLSRTAAACCGKAHPILRELQGRARAARRYRPLSSPAFPNPTIAPKNRPAIVGIAASQKDAGSFPSPATVAEAMEVLSRTRNPARRPNRTALGRLSLSKKPRCVSGGMRLPAANGGGGQAGLRQNAGKGATTTTAARAFRERTTHRWRQATWHIVVPFFFSFFPFLCVMHRRRSSRRTSTSHHCRRRRRRPRAVIVLLCAYRIARCAGEMEKRGKRERGV